MKTVKALYILNYPRLYLATNKGPTTTESPPQMSYSFRLKINIYIYMSYLVVMIMSRRYVFTIMKTRSSRFFASNRGKRFDQFDVGNVWFDQASRLLLAFSGGKDRTDGQSLRN